MYEILPKLYISDITDARNDVLLQQNNISSIISVLTEPVSFTDISRIRHHKQVHIDDVEDADMLSSLPDCIDFIERGRAEGGVLIHCFAGVSRCVSVCMAYVMKAESIDCPAAFRRIKSICPDAYPNEGFRHQLKLFYAMKCKLDLSNPEYKLHRLKHLQNTRHEAAAIEPAALAADPFSLPIGKDETVIRCRSCRRRIISDENVLEHLPGSGEISFAPNKRDHATLVSQSAVHACSSLFVEPMVWMSSVANGEHEGKILCPKCQGRLGHFNWAGEQCSCGAWITPSFQVHKAKVDIINPSVSLRAMHISSNTTTNQTPSAKSTSVATADHAANSSDVPASVVSAESADAPVTQAAGAAPVE